MAVEPRTFSRCPLRMPTFSIRPLFHARAGNKLARHDGFSDLSDPS